MSKKKSRKPRGVKPRNHKPRTTPKPKPGKQKPLRKKNLFGFGGGRKLVSIDEVRDLQKDAARSFCSKGEYKAAQKTARMSPKKFAKQRGMKVEGMVDRAKKRVKKKVAEKALSWLKENPTRKKKNCAKANGRKKPAKRRAASKKNFGKAAALQAILGKLLAKRNGRQRKNGELSRAEDLFKKFQGRDPEEIIEYMEHDVKRENYVKLGDLTKLELAGKMTVDFGKSDLPILSSNADGAQLYIMGGNQNMQAVIESLGVDASKDYVDLGEVTQLEYFTRKKLDNFQPVYYYHELGEESGEVPRLMYDQLNKQLHLIGGAYEVQDVGIVN
ncbi:MAG TPA: hypothetical protein VH024_00255 [Candidatus Angelobacter sp.]|jgi:hypothetical protein|nr:hypothetical protein [Candidatus Angelobacter sp.]